MGALGKEEARVIWGAGRGCEVEVGNDDGV